MPITIAALRKLAEAKRKGNVCPIGSTNPDIGCGTVPGMFSFMVTVEIYRFDGTKTAVKGFSDQNCKLHQHMLWTEAGWESPKEFFIEDPYSGLAEMLGVESAMPRLLAV